MLQCRIILLLLLIILTGRPAPCAAAGTDADTLEQFNKAMHDFNQKYTVSSANGASRFFSETIPEGVRHGVINFFSNLSEPVVAVSSLVRGDVDNAGIAAKRFGYNLVFGFGGVFDRATEAGVIAEPRDLGETICSSGLVPDGPYLVLPFYGPSTVGDMVGSALPMLAGYVALGEAFWVIRASSRVASYMDDKDLPPKEAGGDAESDAGRQGRIDLAYRLDKERYLAAREALCHKPASPPADGGDAAAVLAAVPLK
ncbi:MAG: MlaA family lipoprotein [Rhodospirillaceae bacterium]